MLDDPFDANSGFRKETAKQFIDRARVMEQTNVHMPNSLSSILRMKRFGNKISTTGKGVLS